MFNIIKTKLEIFRRFMPVLWNLKWWDYSSLLELQLAQLKYMEAHWCVDTCHVGDEKNKKDMQISIILIERILEDKYTYAPWVADKFIFADKEIKHIPSKIEERQTNQDLEYLYNKIFIKKIRSWWD